MQLSSYCKKVKVSLKLDTLNVVKRYILFSRNYKEMKLCEI